MVLCVFLKAKEILEMGRGGLKTENMERAGRQADKEDGVGYRRRERSWIDKFEGQIRL